MKTVSEIIENPSGWDSKRNYMGKTDFPNMFCVLTRTRDSDLLTESNWEVALEMLGGESEVDDGEEYGNVSILRFGHWACGWWEMIAVKGNTEEYEIAEKISENLRNYPILNEDHYSGKEYNEACELWEEMSIRERVELCQKNEISIFAARHDYMPETRSGEYIVNLY